MSTKRFLVMVDVDVTELGDGDKGDQVMMLKSMFVK